MNTKKTLWTALAVLVVLIIGLYAAGYRFSGKGLSGPGSLSVQGTKNASVFVDGKQQESLSAIKLPAGTHVVLVAEEGRWPWKKDLEIMGGTNATVTPFLARSDATGTIAVKGSAEQARIVQAVAKSKLATESNPLVSADNKVSAWVLGSSIMAKWQGEAGETVTIFSCAEENCTLTREIFTAEEDIRSLAFYPGRNDVLLVAISNGIYALEINKEGGQNFQPIYKGTKPSFSIQDTDSLNVVDGTVALSIAID